MIEGVSHDPLKDYKILLNELKAYNPKVSRKPKIAALTKMDIVDKKEMLRLGRMKFGRGVQTMLISAVVGDGIDDLLDRIWDLLIKKSS